jgi:hypothetical protein
VEGRIEMARQLKGLNSWLNYYYTNCQKEILLVHRGTVQDNWAKRCLYLSKDFQPRLEYNHRTLLDSEVVFEYDMEDQDINKLLADKVCKRLKDDNVEYAKWFSGNRSVHVHCLVKFTNVKNPNLLKSTIMKYYGTFYYDEATKTVFEKKVEGRELIRVYPDLRLASKGHLIRAEYGLHEKTQQNKKLIFKTPEYPTKSALPIKLWEDYEKAQNFSVMVRLGQQTSDLAESDTVKKLLDTVQFKENFDDGRERVLFALIHILKPKYKEKDELTHFLFEWYNYSSSQGAKLSQTDIRNKVRYHWNKDYKITEQFLKNLIDELSKSTT